MLGVNCIYYLAVENHNCKTCKRIVLPNDSRLLAKLSDGLRSRFLVLLTRKYACEQAVVGLFKSRWETVRRRYRTPYWNSTARNIFVVSSATSATAIDIVSVGRLNIRKLERVEYARAPAFRTLPTAK